MARAIAEKLGIDKSNASRQLGRAADDGYIRNLEDRRGKPGLWVLGDPLPEDVELLPRPCDLASGCAVAAVHGEKECETPLTVTAFDGSRLVIDPSEVFG
jgi:hypothetical protein